MIPVHKPLHNTLVPVGVVVSGGGEVIDKVTVLVQPKLSVTFTVYEPTHKLVATDPDPAAAGVQLYVNGATPPVAVIVAVPLQEDEQERLLFVTVSVIGGGCVMVVE